MVDRLVHHFAQPTLACRVQGYTIPNLYAYLKDQHYNLNSMALNTIIIEYSGLEYEQISDRVVWLIWSLFYNNTSTVCSSILVLSPEVFTLRLC